MVSGLNFIKMRKIVLYVFLIVLVFIVYCLWNIFGPVVNNPGKKFLYIPTGSTYQNVKERLLNNKMISNGFWFDKIADYAGYPEKVKAGKYKITNDMSLYHLVKMLRAGRQEPVNLVITKLRTKADLAKKISSQFETDSLSVIRFMNNEDSVRQFNVDTNTVMTIVIRDTYTYFWNNSVDNIFRKLYKGAQNFWTAERKEKAQKLGLTPVQVYTLASIVEEETNKDSDKGKIASVYINRLKKGMRLAADPTVKFALNDFSLTRIYNKNLQFPSPYNTYLNAGLPPGPICTPSVKTIDAVLDSPQTDYLFFVARPDFSGYSNFASDYQQHQVFAKAYQVALDSLILSRQQKK